MHNTMTPTIIGRRDRESRHLNWLRLHRECNFATQKSANSVPAIKLSGRWARSPRCTTTIDTNTMKELKARS
eukprot:scaffold9793_cov144-Skeletonema_menzelii.AAC.2